MEPERVPLVLVTDEPRSEGKMPELAALFRAHSSYVAAIATRLLGRDDEVDDVVQDVFFEALRGIATLRDRERARSWLATVAVRVATRKLRWRKRFAIIGFDSTPENAPSISAPQEDAAFVRQIYRVLDDLSVVDRVAWILRHVEGHSLDEVAQHCECSLATAKRRIAAAHARIEEAIS